MTALQQDIEVKTSEGSFTAYLAAAAETNGVAVVVLQEIFGVNANIRAIVDGLASAGYAAVAPDLYWRTDPGVQLDPSTEQGRARAMNLMKGLNHDEAVSDGAAALAALRERVPGIDASAAIGYCFGGGVAYLMAVRGKVDAGVAYYGTGLQGMLGELENLEGRLLLHIAGEDHLCPPEAQQAISAAAEYLGERAEVIIHPGVGHAFARIGGGAFDAEAAARADGKTMALLAALATAS